MDFSKIENRVVVDRIPATDGWTELRLACGHSILIITAIGEGLPAPCPECLDDVLKPLRETMAAMRRAMLGEDEGVRESATTKQTSEGGN